jgi:hypothetical protein
MARRRTLNYREYRSYDEDDDSREEDEEEEGEEEESEGDEEEVSEAPRARKAKAAPKEGKPKRSRAGKNVRMKVVWVVFDNSNKRIQAFPYSQKEQAEELAAKLHAEKKQLHFVQPVKEQMET